MEAARACDAEEKRVMGLEKLDPELGYPYAAEACCMLAQRFRSLATPQETQEQNHD